ncbi:MAG: sulfate adenylyltransferase subunit CysD [Phycisphaeraceae bacterium]
MADLSKHLTHLEQLEAESIHIIREVVAECENPVMLYSIGKDSAVMLHLAMKAFRPGRIPFPLMHIDTTFKFPEMIEYRDRLAETYGLELIVAKNDKALEQIGHDPANWSCTQCADLLKRQALIEALTEHGFDAAFGGARRDEEKSRAKERIFSFRDRFQQWDPKNQRPELWNLYNTAHAPGESFRVFPLSNWTELDIWNYIYRENIEIVPLYFSKKRPTIRRDGILLYAGDIVKPRDGEKVEQRTCRFRTLGCQLCTGAVESEADTLEQIVAETMTVTKSERENRAVDKDREGSMEEKKREGYF